MAALTLPPAEMSGKRQRGDDVLGRVDQVVACFSSDEATFHDDLDCSQCSEAIPYQSKHVQLRPCRCPICLECLINAHSRRGCVSPHLRLMWGPGDGAPVDWRWARAAGDGDRVQRYGEERRRAALKQNQPFDFMLRKDGRKFMETAAAGRATHLPPS